MRSRREEEAEKKEGRETESKSPTLTKIKRGGGVGQVTYGAHASSE